MRKAIIHVWSSKIPMYAFVAILNSVLSLLMATLISGLFDRDTFIEFYATLSASLLGVTLAQFGLGNVMLSFRGEIAGNKAGSQRVQ